MVNIDACKAWPVMLAITSYFIQYNVLTMEYSPLVQSTKLRLHPLEEPKMIIL